MDARIEKDGSRYTLIVERRLEYPVERVWRVLTERELLKQWFPCDVEGEWTVGAPLRFVFLHEVGDGVSEEDLVGEVIAVEPPSLLEYRWGRSVIRCELHAESGACRFVLSELLEDPSMGARSAAGWEMCLQNLDTVLQAGTVAKFVWDVWQAKFDRYVKLFTPTFGKQEDAATRPTG